MSNVNELIERLRGDIFDAVPDDNDMQNVLSVAADALESEHAEVERLRDVNMIHLRSIGAFSTATERAEAAVAELADANADLIIQCDNAEAKRDKLQRIIDGYDRTPAEARAHEAEAENARLTAQLQAVREVVDNQSPFGEDVAASDLRAILDAAADGCSNPECPLPRAHSGPCAPKNFAADVPEELDEMTLADIEQEERDHAFGWPDPDGADDAR